MGDGDQSGQRGERTPFLPSGGWKALARYLARRSAAHSWISLRYLFWTTKGPGVLPLWLIALVLIGAGQALGNIKDAPLAAAAKYVLYVIGTLVILWSMFVNEKADAEMLQHDAASKQTMIVDLQQEMARLAEKDAERALERVQRAEKDLERALDVAADHPPVADRSGPPR